MPITHVTKVYAVTDCKVKALLSDETGGTATYGEPVDIPGIKTLKISGDVETKELRGDNQLLDSDSTLTNISVELEYAKLSLDALAVFFADAPVVDTGATPNQIATWQLMGTTRMAPFAIEAVSASSDVIGGNVLMGLGKCTISSFPELGFEEEDYKTSPLELAAAPLLSTGQWLYTRIQETRTDAMATTP